jgi:hypothetical protein
MFFCSLLFGWFLVELSGFYLLVHTWRQLRYFIW